MLTLHSNFFLPDAPGRIHGLVEALCRSENRIFYRTERTSCREYKADMHSLFRLVRVLRGSYIYTICRNDEIRKITLCPGDVLFCARQGTTRAHLERNSGTVMLTLSFFPQFIRFLISETLEQEGQTVAHHYWYHTNRPLSEAGWNVLHALNALSQSSEEFPSLFDLVRFLFRHCDESLAGDTAQGRTRALMTYQRINAYLTENLHRHINRESVARKMKLSPSHVSKLFRQFGDQSFNQTLRRMRLELALDLLRENVLSVKEIADQCGFSSPGYFIETFRNSFGKSPGDYRLN